MDIAGCMYIIFSRAPHRGPGAFFALKSCYQALLCCSICKNMLGNRLEFGMEALVRKRWLGNIDEECCLQCCGPATVARMAARFRCQGSKTDTENVSETLEGCPNLKVDCSPCQNDVFS